MHRHLTVRLHEIALSPAFRLVITHHAGKQMQDRDVTRLDVERVLKAGAVVLIETDVQGRERWRVAGRDADGLRIEPVVEVIPPDKMVLVTVIRIERLRSKPDDDDEGVDDGPSS
jgi:Domain of unknown function (DUF4258)